jgi:prevent-host-death family protein
MKTVPVAELKASLSAYLRRVKAGEDVLVTERGRPIARLTPAGTAGWPSHLESMEAQGLITAGVGKLPSGFWRLPRPKDPKGLVMRGLLEEREGGR